MQSTSLTQQAPLEDPGFDRGRLAQYLRQHIPDFSDELTVRRFQGGQSNPTFLLTSAGTRYVLRKKPSGPLLPSAHAIDREYRVMSALAHTDVPVPRMWCLCEDNDVIGTAFYVMAHVDGRVSFDPSLPDMSNEERAAVFDDANRVIAALHSVDYSSLGLADFGKPGSYLERQIGRWTRQYRASETDRISSMEELMAWLPEHIPPEQKPSLVHGDYRLDNLILHPREPRVIAVLDWELSTLGDPLADFAYHMQAWRLRGDQFRGMAEHDLGALGIPTESNYLATYFRRLGRPQVDPATWEFYLAFSMFRLAAILQGILRRALDGNAADAKAHETGRRARIISDVAWHNISSRRL